MTQSRRDFFCTAGCGALSAAVLMSGVQRFGLVNALAQSSDPGSYKALVCIFFFGGNDGNNMVIPFDTYDPGPRGYFAQRNGKTAISKDSLLQITPPSDPGGLTYGLHPNLVDLQGLWLQGKLAIVPNVGTLIRPITKDDYIHNPSLRPYQLFSHSDQQTSWQTAYANGPYQTGWGGRTADNTQGISGDLTFPVITSVFGNNVFDNGLNTSPLIIGTGPLNTALPLRLPNGDPYQLKDSIKLLLDVDTDNTLNQGASSIKKQSITNSDLLTTDPTLQTTFPNTSLGNQLKTAAKLIKLREGLGLTRQIFFCALGGFDTHTGQINGQGGLFTQVNAAMKAFYDATIELGVSSQVTTFTHSDFGRTLNPGGTAGMYGSDHGWGSHAFVMGDAVMGGNFYGTYPDVEVGSSDDTDVSNPRGRWIPTTSVDQYAATLAQWYGLDAGLRSTVFPNIGNFATADLGFMNSGAQGSGAQGRRSGNLSGRKTKALPK